MNDNTELSETGSTPVHNPAPAIQGRFAAQLLRISIDALANQRTLWPVTPQQQQQEIIDRIRNAFSDVIAHQVGQIAAAGFANAEVTLQTITAKGDAIKAVVILNGQNTLHEMIDAIGRKVMLVLVDAEVYTAGMESFEAQKDQPDLPLEGFGTQGQEAA